MSYPLIILGAGASFDFLIRNDYPRDDTDLDRWIPPLTDNLFNGVQFQSLLSKYKEMNELVGYIRGKIRSNRQNVTFEGILTKLYQDGVRSNPDLYKSFAALLFYLCDLFGTVTEKYYRPHNNYDTLRHIISLNGNQAVFVNFNYDLFLERSFGKNNAERVDQYLEGNFPIVKIHGSYNWFWNRLVNAFAQGKQDCYELSIKGAQYIFNPGDNIQKWELIIYNNPNPQNIRAQRLDGLRAYSFHPALALPLIGKDNFVCPSSHVDFLRRKLKEIDRIVIIGWKMADPFMRGLLLEELKQRSIPITFVGGRNSKSLIDVLDKDIRQNLKLINSNGFSNFISSDEGEGFFT